MKEDFHFLFVLLQQWVFFQNEKSSPFFGSANLLKKCHPIISPLLIDDVFSLSKVHSINFLYLNLDFFQDEIVEGDKFMKVRLILNFTSGPNRVVLQVY